MVGYPTDPDVGLHEGKFTDGTADGSVLPSLDPAAWANMVTDELINVIIAAGMVPDFDDPTQLSVAIGKLVAAGRHAVVIQEAAFAPGVADGQPVRWDAGNNRFALAAADGTANDLVVGFADVTNTAVYCFGASRAGLFSGLTPGARYFLSASSGQITTVAAADTIYVGIATAANVLAIDIDPGSALASYARLDTQQTWTKSQNCSNNVLVDGATITPDLSGPPEGYVGLGGNRTLALPTGLVAGKRQRFELDVYQDSTGSRTLAYAWCYRWAGGTAGTLSTTALQRDKLFGDVAYYNTGAVTISLANPGVMTWAGHGLITGQQLQLTTTGALPTGLSASTTYYAIVIDANTFWLASSLANAAAGTKIATSGAQNGIHTATACAIDLALSKGFG